MTTAFLVPPALPAPTPDDATVLVQRCGNPDRDSITPGKMEKKTPESRWLLYSSARVRAGFERDSQSPGAWKSVGYFDPVSKKRLESTQVLKRLPCAASGAIFTSQVSKSSPQLTTPSQYFLSANFGIVHSISTLETSHVCKPASFPR
jgi:hypothetical protein